MTFVYQYTYVVKKKELYKQKNNAEGGNNGIPKGYSTPLASLKPLSAI